MSIITAVQLFEREALDLLFTPIVKELLSYVRGWAPRSCPYNSAQNVQMEENEQKMQREDVDEMAPQKQNGEEEENVGGKEEAAGNGDEESNEALNHAPLDFAVPKNFNEENTTYKKKEESPPVVTEFHLQWQQPSSHCQRDLPHPSSGCCQLDSQTLVAVAGYRGQSTPVSGHQWQYAYQPSSSSMPRGDQRQHGQKISRLIPEPQGLDGQGSSGPMPNQRQHHYHPVGSSDPSLTYGISAQRVI
ncbi:hypothetical protein SLEP1_g17798 [Rubroshorea leprosula]|uniref:Uncharacterized protein n=1 Tax=Rubroshorea leprosula TaxID=152421 RepID=A0AAV5J1B0_9ROSI|nr:hypothetical protein SLEP1_g17798 [Rubroshorea leprosula]